MRSIIWRMGFVIPICGTITLCEKCQHYRTRRIRRNQGEQEYCNLNKNDLPHSFFNRVSGTPRWCPLYAKVKYIKEAKNKC
jgi:hypothetical protein